MRKSLRLLLGVLVLLPVISGTLAAGRATNASANATAEITGAVVKITSVQTSRPGFDESTRPPSTRYRWIRIWLYGLNFTRQTLTLQCKLDKAAWAPCGKFPGSGNSYRTFKGLAPGLHTIRVRLVDSAGNVPSPVSVYPYGMASVEKAPTFFNWRVTGVTGDNAPPPAELLGFLNVSVDAAGSIKVVNPAYRSAFRHRWLTPKPGLYELRLDDPTTAQNIHVVGLAIDRRTSVPGKGVLELRNVRLTPGGKLAFYSDRAPSKRVTVTVTDS